MSNYYVTDKPLEPGVECYVERAAEDDLFAALIRGQLCSLLAPPYMGKTSLISHTRRHLEKYVAVVVLDLLQIPVSKRVEEFCYAVLQKLVVDCDVEEEAMTLWRHGSGLVRNNE